jgi:hypothetical protein
MKHIDRGIKYIALDLECTKLFVFVDSSFANNKDFSYQIGYLFILINKTNFIRTNKFGIKENLIYYSFIKSKRVIWSVLAFKDVNIVIAINTIIKMINKQLRFPQTLIVVYTDLSLLYKCLVKLDIIEKKRLIIDIIAFC